MCDICAYADVHSSWPSTHQGTHSRRTHRSWMARNECECPMCGRHFSTDALAQKHKRMSVDGERVWCINPAIIMNRKTGEPIYESVLRASGEVFVGYMSPEARQRLTERHLTLRTAR